MLESPVNKEGDKLDPIHEHGVDRKNALFALPYWKVHRKLVLPELLSISYGFYLKIGSLRRVQLDCVTVEVNVDRDYGE